MPKVIAAYRSSRPGADLYLRGALETARSPLARQWQGTQLHFRPRWSLKLSHNRWRCIVHAADNVLYRSSGNGRDIDAQLLASAEQLRIARCCHERLAQCFQTLVGHPGGSMNGRLIAFC